MISAAAGTTPDWSIVWIVRQPSSRVRNITCRVPRRFGMGISRNRAWVTTPSVPSEPVKRLVRS